jgi:hypothetical protein
MDRRLGNLKQPELRRYIQGIQEQYRNSDNHIEQENLRHEWFYAREVLEAKIKLDQSNENFRQNAEYISRLAPQSDISQVPFEDLTTPTYFKQLQERQKPQERKDGYVSQSDLQSDLSQVPFEDSTAPTYFKQLQERQKPQARRHGATETSAHLRRLEQQLQKQESRRGDNTDDGVEYEDPTAPNYLKQLQQQRERREKQATSKTNNSHSNRENKTKKGHANSF